MQALRTHAACCYRRRRGVVSPCTRASGRAAAGSSQKDPRDALYTEVDARCDKLSVCLCVCVWFRREALRVPVAGLRLEVRAVGRADAARPQTHRRPAVHVPGLRTRILAIRPPRAARQATLRPVNTHRRRRRRRPRTSYAAAATGDRPLRAVQGPDLQNILRFSIYDYRKFIVRSIYDSDLKRAEISLRNIVS